MWRVLVDNHAGVIAAGAGNSGGATGAVHGVGSTGGRRIDAQGNVGAAARNPVIHKSGVDVAGKTTGGLAGSRVIAGVIIPRMSIAAASGTSLCRRWRRSILDLGHRDRDGVFILCSILGGTGFLAGPCPRSGSAIRIRLLELTIGGNAIRRIALVIGHEHNDHGGHRDYRYNCRDNRGDRGTADAAALLWLGIILLVVLGRLLVISTVIIAIGSRHG